MIPDDSRRLKNQYSWSSNGSGGNSPPSPDTNDDEIILFSASNSRLQQFCTFRKHTDYDNPPTKSNRIKVETLAKGEVQVYKMLGKKAAFIRCGTFVHPILPRLRTWRTEMNEFILPQPIPGKYWRIELSSAAEELEQVFENTCSFKNTVPPPTPPMSDAEDEDGVDGVDGVEEEDQYSSSASTLDRILDKFEDDEETITIPLTHDGDNVAVDVDGLSSSPPLSVSASVSESSRSCSVTETEIMEELVPPPSTAHSSYINHHPLVPLATRNNILSSTFPLKFKPMDDDWLEVSGTNIPKNYHHHHQYQKPTYLNWAGQVTTDLVSSSGNYLSDKMEKMTLYSASYIKGNNNHPQAQWKVPLRPKESPKAPEVSDSFYHQAKHVGGYMGWRLWSKVSPWAAKR